MNDVGLLDIDKWKPFLIGELFRIEPTKGINSTELELGDEIPYIAAKKDNNGLEKNCTLSGFEEWVSEGNCIVFIQLGQGSAGFANYIPTDFIGMSGKTSCGYIDGVMNRQIGLFLTTLLDLNRPKYSFGRSWTGDRLKNTEVLLPILLDSNGNPILDNEKHYSTKGYIPDWEFMNKFIEDIENSERIRLIKLIGC